MLDHPEKISGGNEKVEKMVESLSPEDKKKVSKIVAEHADKETVSEVMEYVNNGDQSGLIKYATENLSEEEIKELTEMYQKYSD